MFNFQYSFQIDHNILTIIQNKDNFELRINNIPFTDLFKNS